jgi:hypothetical protein
MWFNILCLHFIVNPLLLLLFFFVNKLPLEGKKKKKKSIYLSIYVGSYLSMALQPFVGPWPLFQFLDLLHSR